MLRWVAVLLLMLLPGSAGRSLVYYAEKSAGGRDALTVLDADGKAEELPSSAADRLYAGLAIAASSTALYWATDSSIEQSLLDGRQRSTLVAGWTAVTVRGYRFGAEAGDVISLSILGEPCTTLQQWSSTSITCISGSSQITAASVELTVDDIGLTTVDGTVSGGFDGDFIDARLADKGRTPIIMSIQVTTRAERPHAVALHGGYIYWSNHAAGSIERCKLDGSQLAVVLPAAGTVHSMAIDHSSSSSSAHLYYTDAARGVIARAALPSTATVAAVATVAAAVLVEEVVLAGLQRPVALTMDAPSGMLYFAHRGSTISRARTDGANLQLNSLKAPVAHTVVLQRSSTAQISSLALAPPAAATTASIDENAEQRLYWAESGGVSGLLRCSVLGTNVQTLATAAAGGLLWPRSIVLLPGAAVLFTEYLGTLKKLPLTAAGADASAIVTLAQDTYLAAQMLVAREDEWRKRGVYTAHYLRIL
jgi:IPT/TIG domain